jgi:hypothetical protein
MERKVAVSILLMVSIPFVSASDFQISSISHNQTLEENDVLEVEANITNQNSTGTQEVKLLKDSSKVFSQNLNLQANKSKNITLSYSIKSGDAGESAEFRVKTENDTEPITVDIATLEKHFSQGWNYFSLPIATQSRPSISAILEEDRVQAVWRYEDGGWESYAPEAQENPFNSFKGGEGYIVNTDNSFTIRPIVENTMDVENVEDSSPVSEELQQGWNLIGHYWEEKQNTGTNYALDSLASDAVGATYKQANDGELSLTQLKGSFKPGHAYWQFVNTETGYAKSESDPTDGNYNRPTNPEDRNRIPRLEEQLTESIQHNILLKDELGSLNLTPRERYFEQSYYMDEESFINNTKIEVYVTNSSALGENDHYYREIRSDRRIIQNGTKICDTTPKNNTTVLCDLETDELNYSNGEHWVAWNISKIETNGDEEKWESDERHFTVSKRYGIGDRIENDDFWFELNYLEGIIYSDNTDLRKLSLSNTLRNKNVSEFEAFDGISSSMELITTKGEAEDSSIYGPSDLRDGRKETRRDRVEVLSDREPAYITANIELEQPRTEKDYPLYVYDVSNYSQKKMPETTTSLTEKREGDVLEKDNVGKFNVSYSPSSETQLSEEKFTERAVSNVYLIDTKKNTSEEIGSELEFRAEEPFNISEIGFNTTTVCEKVEANEDGNILCDLDKAEYDVFGNQFLVYELKDSSKGAKPVTGFQKLDVVESYQIGEMAENEYVRFNFTNLELEAQNERMWVGDKQILHNKNISTDENKDGIDSQSYLYDSDGTYSPLAGPSSVELGENKTQGHSSGLNSLLAGLNGEKEGFQGASHIITEIDYESLDNQKVFLFDLGSKNPDVIPPKIHNYFVSELYNSSSRVNVSVNVSDVQSGLKEASVTTQPIGGGPIDRKYLDLENYEYRNISLKVEKPPGYSKAIVQTVLRIEDNQGNTQSKEKGEFTIE